jgi:LCP family protein required for cell wall assembly
MTQRSNLTIQFGGADRLATAWRRLGQFTRSIPSCWRWAALPVLVLGAITGAMLYVTTHSVALTGTAVWPRPAGSARPFGWPLRLERRVNILLIGIDTTIDDQRRVLPFSRSDTLMLVSFDPQRHRINALSIPRDTYATLPGAGGQKINAAYAFGGPRLTIRAVEALLGVPVHYYVKLGAASFARIVNALGGVEIDVEKDMKYSDTWGDLYINLKKGRQVLSGDQTTHYIRFRSDSEGDIGRVRRQQKVLAAILHKLKSPSTVLSAPRLVQAFGKNTQTNLSAGELITLGLFALRRGSEDIHTGTLPGEAGPVYVVADEAQMQGMVAEMFVGVDVKTLSSAAVEVLNGSGVPGLARLTAARLERLGFHVVRIDTAPQPVRTTTIISRAGHPEVARALADLLGQERVTYASGRGIDITVVVAPDLLAPSRVRSSWYRIPASATSTLPVPPFPSGAPHRRGEMSAHQAGQAADPFINISF